MEVFDAFIHPVSELAKEVLELEDSSQHVPVLLRL
jgi:hypothetical protein